MTVRTDSATGDPLAFSLALGTLAGAALIVTTFLTNRGPVIFIPYAGMMLLTAAYLKFGCVATFKLRFRMALGSFMFASMLLYVFIATVPTEAWRVIPVWGHAWRIGLIIAIGSALSAAVAQLTSPWP